MAAPELSMWGGANGYQEGRAYRDPFDGKTYPSITTVLKMADKSGLIQWAVGLTLDAVNRNPDQVYQRSDQDMKRYFGYQWTKVRDERAEVGTGVHEAIESVDTGSTYPFLDAEQERIMQRFEEFDFAHDRKPILTEFTVFDPDLGYMGTADGFWEIDGALWLIDNKTSKNTWPEHFAQLAALRHAPLALINVPEGTEGAAKHVNKKNGETWWIKVPNPGLKSAKVGILHLREDFWKLIEVENTEIHKEIFDGYLQVFNAKSRLKMLEKEKEEN